MNLSSQIPLRPRNERVGTGPPLLSVVLPVYNERRVLEQLLAEIERAVEKCGPRYEVVFVNDGSTDGSGPLLDTLARRHPFVKVLHLSRNFGHQAAIQAGLSHARGDCLVLMDSDLQDDPGAIIRFYREWLAGYEVVYAVRRDRQEGPFKKLLFAGFHWLLSRVAETPIPRDAGIFGLIDRRVAREISRLAERDRYLPGLRGWVGFRQKGIEVRRRARYDRHPRVSLRGLCRLAKTALFSFSSMPLALFYVIGCSALSAFLLLSGYALFSKLFTTWTIPGWTSHVLTASFFGAVNALGISILGEYVTRIYDQVRGRPLYLVARAVNLPSPDSAGEGRSAGGGTSSTIGETADQETGLCEQLLAEAETLLESTPHSVPATPSPAPTTGLRLFSDD